MLGSPVITGIPPDVPSVVTAPPVVATAAPVEAKSKYTGPCTPLIVLVTETRKRSVPVGQSKAWALAAVKSKLNRVSGTTGATGVCKFPKYLTRALYPLFVAALPSLRLRPAPLGFPEQAELVHGAVHVGVPPAPLQAGLGRLPLKLALDRFRHALPPS